LPSSNIAFAEIKDFAEFCMKNQRNKTLTEKLII